MTSAWVEHPLARTEHIDAAVHLDDVHPGLGETLLDAAERAISTVLESPNARPPVPYWKGTPRLRAKSVAPFRLQVIDYAEPIAVHIVAYVHESRAPGYWARRLTE